MIFELNRKEMKIVNTIHEMHLKENSLAGLHQVLRNALRNEYKYVVMQEMNEYQDWENDKASYATFKKERDEAPDRSKATLNMCNKKSAFIEMETVFRYYNAENDVRYIGAYLIEREANRLGIEVDDNYRETAKEKIARKRKEKERSMRHFFTRSDKRCYSKGYILFSEDEFDKFQKGKQYVIANGNIPENATDNEYVDYLINYEVDRIQKYIFDDDDTPELADIKQRKQNKMLKQFNKYLSKTYKKASENYELTIQYEYLQQMNDDTKEKLQTVIDFYKNDHPWINQAIAIKYFICKSYLTGMVDEKEKNKHDSLYKSDQGQISTTDICG